MQRSVAVATGAPGNRIRNCVVYQARSRRHRSAPASFHHLFCRKSQGPRSRIVRLVARYLRATQGGDSVESAQRERVDKKRGVALLRRLVRFDVRCRPDTPTDDSTPGTASQQRVDCRGWSARESTPGLCGVSSRQSTPSKRPSAVLSHASGPMARADERVRLVRALASTQIEAHKVSA